MGTRGEDSNCPFAISTLRRKLRKPNNWSPGPAGYRELFTDEALLLRARNCDVHQGDWAVALPVVAAFLAAIPAAADTLSIAQAARSDPRFDSLSVDDRRLALALLSYSDSLRIYTTVHGHREAIGQHRICAARTAGVTHLPVWYDSRSRARRRPPQRCSAARKPVRPNREVPLLSVTWKRSERTWRPGGFAHWWRQSAVLRPQLLVSVRRSELTTGWVGCQAAPFRLPRHPIRAVRLRAGRPIAHAARHVSATAAPHLHHSVHVVALM